MSVDSSRHKNTKNEITPMPTKITGLISMWLDIAVSATMTIEYSIKCEFCRAYHWKTIKTWGFIDQFSAVYTARSQRTQRYWI